MRVIVGDRQTGKTEALLQWLMTGQPINEQPYWDRIVLSHNVAEKARLSRLVVTKMRKRQIAEGAVEVPDFHIERARLAVWCLADYQRITLGIRSQAKWELAVDNVELLLSSLIGGQKSITAMTVTGIAEVLNPPQVPHA